MRIHNLHCHSFIPSLAANARIAIDCGANVGDFADWLSQNTPAQVYSFEPDPRLFGGLPEIERVEWIEAAVDGESGVVKLGLGENLCSSTIYRESESQPTVTVQRITLQEFCASRGIKRIDFLKLDIEGAELSVLENCSADFLQSITQIAVEFHDFLNGDDVPRIKAIVARLRRLGFHFVRFSHRTWGDCLFVNENHTRISWLSKIQIALLGKYLPGFRRILMRLLNRTSRLHDDSAIGDQRSTEKQVGWLASNGGSR